MRGSGDGVRITCREYAPWVMCVEVAILVMEETTDTRSRAVREEDTAGQSKVGTSPRKASLLSSTIICRPTYQVSIQIR